ncbi:thymidine phosphorylase [Caldimonas brevitalea]|uniref:Thymidine phosphorylase n=1 Tax=Caldimonas brevitalea TaxID=413882 RepID=A0A0G3BIH2_9BURK|nr:thymidine phosphorylase [Caldimonas brevitalea]AKJ29172.1 thymidine phosphorylase [Caldimonas brevitalea]
MAVAIPAPLPQETIRRKRDAETLTDAELAAFVAGLVDGGVSDAQAAAFAMAVCCRGMSRAECVALTRAMRDSGECLQWHPAEMSGPVVDKHSTGGVGDTVSLMLAPMLAACGAHVPMISGRGLGHTGGTLDKLEAIPGYRVQPGVDVFRRIVREVGVAIVGAGERLAPADRRLYAVRDVTATVESLHLITASILSKKLAAGLQSLVLDVKVGCGAFMPTRDAARELACSLVEVGQGAGLPTRALLTDMEQPLAPCAGNTLEVQLTLDYLSGRQRPQRLHEVVLALGATLLLQAGLAADAADACARLEQTLASGAAAERFARMVAALGGPASLFEQSAQHLAAAPVTRAVLRPGTARVTGIDTRALGWVVVGLGGGRRHASDRVDPAVGLSALAPLGVVIEADQPIAWVHARDAGAADAAAAAVQAAYRWGDAAQPVAVGPVVLDVVAASNRAEAHDDR